jgi:hypothetical protein
MTTAFMSCDPEVFGAIWKIRASLARRRSLWVDQGFRFEMRPKSRRNRGLHVGGFAEASLVRTAAAITEMTAG